MLTVVLPMPLRRSLACTRRDGEHDGDGAWREPQRERWLNATIALRCTAAGMLEATMGFRRLKANKYLPVLRAALVAEHSKYLPNELIAKRMPHSIIHGDAGFAHFNKIRGIPARGKTMYQVHPVTITGIACSLLLTSTCNGEPIRASGEENTVTHELKALQDPTILIRRIWVDTEWNRFVDDSSELQQTVAGVWAWPISGRADWGVRLKVPFKMHFGGHAEGDTDKRGLGDLELAAGIAFRLSDTWRAGGGMQLHVPSGTDISDNTWRLQEFGAVAWDATPWLTFSPSFEHNHSVAEQRGAAPQHFLELFFPATFLMPSEWAVTVAYEPKIDFENNSAWTHSAKLQLAKKLEELPLGFALSLKKPFSGNKDFQLNFISTYYFSSK